MRVAEPLPGRPPAAGIFGVDSVSGSGPKAERRGDFSHTGCSLLAVPFFRNCILVKTVKGEALLC